MCQLQCCLPSFSTSMGLSCIIGICHASLDDERLYCSYQLPLVVHVPASPLSPWLSFGLPLSSNSPLLSICISYKHYICSPPPGSLPSLSLSVSFCPSVSACFFMCICPHLAFFCALVLDSARKVCAFWLRRTGGAGEYRKTEEHKGRDRKQEH